MMARLHNPFPYIREQKIKSNIGLPCPLCGRDAKVTLSPHTIPFITVYCPNCIKYAVQEDLFQNFDDAEHAYLLSGEMRHTQENMSTHLISVDSAQEIVEKQKQLESENRSKAYLIWHYDQKEGDRNNWREYINLPAVAYCRDEEELKDITDKAVGLGYLEMNGDRYKPTVSGVNFSREEREKERQKLIRDMERLQSKYIEIDEELEKKFKLISTRNATFYAMTADEKLEAIVNLIENLLKKDNKYLKLNYSELCGEFLSDECVKSYREKLQCFRHSAEQSLEERNAFSDEQKDFFIDYGVVIVKATFVLLQENELLVSK